MAASCELLFLKALETICRMRGTTKPVYVPMMRRSAGHAAYREMGITVLRGDLITVQRWAWETLSEHRECRIRGRRLLQSRHNQILNGR